MVRPFLRLVASFDRGTGLASSPSILREHIHASKTSTSVRMWKLKASMLTMSSSSLLSGLCTHACLSALPRCMRADSMADVDCQGCKWAFWCSIECRDRDVGWREGHLTECPRDE